MRNKFLMLSAAVATAALMATPASAHSHSKKYVAPVVAGAVVGTVVGIGLHQAWWGSSLGGAALPTSVGGAVAGGFLAGVGTVVLIHSVTTPCHGFQAFFGPVLAPETLRTCVNGKPVGYRTVRARY